MKGLVGLALGAVLGYGAMHSYNLQPMLFWGLWALSYLLVWLWGRRGRPVNSTAVAVAVAAAKAEAESSSSAQVQVNFFERPRDELGDRLQRTGWYNVGDVDQDHELQRAASQMISDGRDADDLDDMDPSDLIERARRGDVDMAT